MKISKKVDIFNLTIEWDGNGEVVVLDRNGNVIDCESLDTDTITSKTVKKKINELEQEMFNSAGAMG